MKVVSFHAAGATAWDHVADHAGDAWLFHRAAWVEIEARFAARGNFSFAVADDKGRLLGIQPLYSRQRDRGWSERLLDSGYHRHTGLALRDDLSESVRRQAAGHAMQHLFALAARLDVDRIQLNRQNLAPALLTPHVPEVPFWVAEHGFELGMHLGPAGDAPVPGAATVFADQVVCLDGTADALFQNLDSACQRAIRKAERAGLTFAADLPDPVAQYYDLAQVSAQRTGEVLLPREYYQLLHVGLGGAGRAAVLFALHEAKPVAGLFLIFDKGAASFLGGVSHHDYLVLRVNDFLHWQAIRWCHAQGLRHYRLGPIFPELPNDWPVSAVSRFKGKFGGRSYPVIQGNYFCKPERYRDDCVRVAQESWQARAQIVTERRQKEANRQAQPALDMALILRRYGFIGIAPRPKETEVVQQLGIWSAQFSAKLEEVAGAVNVIFAAGAGALTPLTVKSQLQTAPAWIYPARSPGFFQKRQPAYRALCPYVTFSGTGIEPIWKDAGGAAVLAWHHANGKRTLLVGLDPVAEITRYVQGDPEQVYRTIDRSRFNFTFERANYLFDTTLAPGQAHLPWADRLGFTLARLLAQATGLPLAEPLPGGAAGAVLLTGDDDQAALAKYREQLELVGDFPITYFLLPMTKHTPATLAELPPSAEFGLHVDALEHPDEYDRICAEQCEAVRRLSGKPVRAIRNHGFLNRGYLGHLHAWESSGLTLDVNYAGLDGTILNGSLLPGHVRRLDGSWSSHLSLLTAFGDGMLYIHKWTEAQAIQRIHALAQQTERTDPGVLVFNMHPENVSDARAIHGAILALGRRPRWIALGVESYLTWLQSWHQLTVRRDGAELVLHAPQPVANLVLKQFDGQRWTALPVPTTAKQYPLRSLRPAA